MISTAFVCILMADLSLSNQFGMSPSLSRYNGELTPSSLGIYLVFGKIRRKGDDLILRPVHQAFKADAHGSSSPYGHENIIRAVSCPANLRFRDAATASLTSNIPAFAYPWTATGSQYIFSSHFFGPLHAEFKNIPDHGVLFR